MLKKKYEIITDCPKSMDWDEYENKIVKEYAMLIKTKKSDERSFQDFFERHPCMLPGAFGFFGE